MRKLFIVAVLCAMVTPAFDSVSQEPPSPPLPPTLELIFIPSDPVVAEDIAKGTTVATVVASWSDGSEFTGTLQFGPPYYDDDGLFALVGDEIVVNIDGPGLAGLANTTRYINVEAVP